MTKEEMESFLNQKIQGLNDFVNGYKACATNIIARYDELKKESDESRIQTNAGNPEAA